MKTPIFLQLFGYKMKEKKPLLMSMMDRKYLLRVEKSNFQKAIYS